MKEQAKMRSQIYLKILEKEIVRVLSLMDRESFSPTFGCMDRTYWAWKFTDFPGARFQEGLFFLSFVYENFRGEYNKHPKLLEWIEGGFNFWSKIQYRRGDFDEAYPFEHSLAATAFTSFYLSEAWSIVKENLSTDTANQFKSAILKAGNWLIKNDEKHGFLSNHLAAAAAALYHIFLVTGQEKFENRSKYFIDKILNHQSAEGWFEEYGGADPGYQTHGCFYLTRYYELNPSEELSNALMKSLEFLAYFVHPDGSIGGEYASRNTQTYYPAAFEMMSQWNGRAKWIADQMFESVESLAAAGLGTVDIYNYFPLLNNYVFAYNACSNQTRDEIKPIAPVYTEEIMNFPQAGIIKVRKKRFELYIASKKGGVIKAFDIEKKYLILNNSGYIGKFSDGSLFSNQSIDESAEINIEKNRISIKGHFYKIKKPVLNPVSFLGFRFFNLTFGRFQIISYWLKSLLVKVLIYKKTPLPINFERFIIINKEQIRVKDRLFGSPPKPIIKLSNPPVFTTIHMGSSRYFVPNEIEYCPESGSEMIDPSEFDKIEQGITIERTIQI